MAKAIKNKAVRSTLYQRERKDKTQAKLARRLALREAEQAEPALRTERLAANVPRTVENTREWVGAGFIGRPGSQAVDRRAMPVELVDDGEGGQRLDLAGLEDLFPDEEPLRMLPTDAEPSEPAQPEASTSATTLDDVDEKPGRGRVLITTAPKPAEDTLAFLGDLENLLGGPDFAQIVPRKTTRFVLSKVTRWAAKRGYSAIVVVGEDLKRPATVTISKLPLGPTAHFRLTSVELNKDIQVRRALLVSS
jgi:ribosome production factor 1